MGALAAMRSASCSAVGRTSSFSTIRLTRPQRSASSLATYSPVSSISRAMPHGDALGQDDGAEVRTHADGGLGQAELDAGCRDAEVAGQREFEPARDGVALQRGDDRHRSLGDHLEQRTAGPVHRRPEALAALVALADLLEVEAGAESGPVSGEDHRAHAVVLRAVQQLLDQVGLQRAGESVAALGPVEGEYADVPAVLDDQSGLPSLRLLAHRLFVPDRPPRPTVVAAVTARSAAPGTANHIGQK